jgi:hypothetical protein
MRNLIALLVLPLCFACATHPEQVPEIDNASLPKLQLEGLKPQTMSLEVRNTRKVNETAGNSTAVASAVQASLADSLTRGGFKLGPSKNHLNVTIQDCTDAPDGAECVNLMGKLATPRMELEMDSTMIQGMMKGTHFQYGDISQAYQGGLKLLIQGLDKKYNEVKNR